MGPSVGDWGGISPACMESLCIIASQIPHLVCISCGEMRVHSCVPFQYEVFCGYCLLAIVVVMITIMSLCIPGYHWYHLLYSDLYTVYISYLLRCVGAKLGCISLLYSSTCIVSGVDVL